MTVAELRALLADYPDGATVAVEVEGYAAEITGTLAHGLANTAGAYGYGFDGRTDYLVLQTDRSLSDPA